MTGNKVMKLWTVLVAAFMAVLASFGFASTATAAPVSQHAQDGNCAVARTTERTAALAPEHERQHRTLPPTMRQRISAEAHGASPTCRPSTTTAASQDAPQDDPDEPQNAAPAPTADRTTGAPSRSAYGEQQDSRTEDAANGEKSDEAGATHSEAGYGSDEAGHGSDAARESGRTTSGATPNTTSGSTPDTSSSSTAQTTTAPSGPRSTAPKSAAPANHPATSDTPSATTRPRTRLVIVTHGHPALFWTATRTPATAQAQAQAQR